MLKIILERSNFSVAVVVLLDAAVAALDVAVAALYVVVAALRVADVAVAVAALDALAFDRYAVALFLHDVL